MRNSWPRQADVSRRPAVGLYWRLGGIGVGSIGAVIVTWNSAAEIEPCLDALLACGIEEVVVVDNASQDDTRERVRQRPGVRLIANPWNRGFAAAVNQGVAVLRSRLVLLVNPDAEVQGGLQALAEACSDPGVAAATGKLVDHNGRPQVGFMVRRFPTAWTLALEMLGVNRIWPSNPVNRRYRCLDLDPDWPADVHQPAGAFLMLRRDVWQELGGLDEGFYPLWFEDVDWLKRAADAGYRVRYEPRAVARHRGGRSALRLSWIERQLSWYDNLFRYAARHLGPVGRGAICAAAILACLLRAPGGICRAGGRGLWVYVRIVRLAIRRLTGGWKEGERLVPAVARR